MNSFIFVYYYFGGGYGLLVFRVGKFYLVGWACGVCVLLSSGLVG